MAGLTSNVESVLDACHASGVMLRRPKEGKLRPILTRGTPPAGLLERVREHREALAAHIEGLFEAVDELAADTAAECAERGGDCRNPDLCPWSYTCAAKGAQHANKC